MSGEDFSTGESYDHRKQWIVSRLKFLSYIYSIDICAYAVMSNQYHVVLHVDKSRAQSWSRTEVVERWMQFCKGDMLVEFVTEKFSETLDRLVTFVILGIEAAERLSDGNVCKPNCYY